MSWACGKCDREKRKIKGDIIPEHFRTCPKRKSMTTNETLIEKALNINRHWWIARAMTTYGVKKAVAELIYEDIQAILEDKAQDVASALQAKEREMVQEIEKWMNDEIIDGYGRALVIDVEQWKKLKSKLSNLSEK